MALASKSALFDRACSFIPPRFTNPALTRSQPMVVASCVTAAVAVPGYAGIPVTVKTRLGYEDQAQFLEIVQGIEAAGADELTVHARTKRHGYRPPAYWEEIARAREQVNIPIIANGEIWSPADALRCREVSGCEDLMLGRGALCRPDLPRLVRAMAEGESLEPLAWEGIAPLLLDFFGLNLAHYDPGHAGNPLKQWLVYLRSHYLQAAILFEEIKRLRDPGAIETRLRREASAADPGRDAA